MQENVVLFFRTSAFLFGNVLVLVSFWVFFFYWLLDDSCLLRLIYYETGTPPGVNHPMHNILNPMKTVR